MLKHSPHLIAKKSKKPNKQKKEVPEIKFERQLLQDFQHNFADPGD